ncbi:DUF2807 domain-containing protein [Flavobacterium arcticum]|uniref:DUF2807 domain-containing protein n=1 Tax=Flavobacterium arcticum TaxID=1784713 RepID=A0A345H870_9FLAO|nr:DUF2807 domain-containing protein [Flavobacterium arcticum]AXG72780.1 DUF2807 domain-containing protein [Flavobacterium arcticum]KAF2510950.1 DUF2807 domain-containing protein [Flavobacterium arcticum]
MKNVFIVLLAILCSTATLAQKKERIKGSKTVTVTQKEVGAFDNLEIEDNFEVFLVKGDVEALEVDADDNLHEIVAAEMYGSTLRITTTKNVTNSKKLSVRITYTEKLTNITAKHEVVLNALTSLELDNITVKNLDYSKSYLNVKSKNFSLIMDDKTKAEVNIQADSTAIILSKNADLKALVVTKDAKIDLYQKAAADIEGDATKAKIRLDNNAELDSKKFTIKSLDILAEGYSNCNVLATETISISASGKTEIQLYGTPKIEIKSFTENATLYKKD